MANSVVKIAKLLVLLMLIPFSELAVGQNNGRVDGRSVSRVEFGTSNRDSLGWLEQVGPRRWRERGHSRRTFDFDELNRDDWSVYLEDSSRGVRLQIDLHTGWVYYSDRLAPQPRELYRILNVEARQSRNDVCGRALQGQVAWDYKGTRKWNSNNIARLCARAVDIEPASCFARVMHGGINWGGGVQWQWENALSLCAGSVSARSTIACFEGQLSITGSWRQSIDNCRR
jgi:hypothetical protein